MGQVNHGQMLVRCPRNVLVEILCSCSYSLRVRSFGDTGPVSPDLDLRIHLDTVS